MGRLEGKRAIVTGAGSGIGRATALLFAQEGARVLAVDRDAGPVEETAALAQGEVIAMAADAGDEAQVRGYVARALEAFGGIDVVHANVCSRLRIFAKAAAVCTIACSFRHW